MDQPEQVTPTRARAGNGAELDSTTRQWWRGYFEDETMNKAERQQRMLNRLMELGFSYRQSDSLRRIEQTLHTWSVHECNGTIERDDETGRPYWSREGQRIGATSDRERGALKRAQEIINSRNNHLRQEIQAGQAKPIRMFHQGDPRGCSLYLYSVDDLNGLSIDFCYDSRGTHCCGR